MLTAAPGRAAAVDGGRPTLPPAPAAAALPSPVKPIPTPDDEDLPADGPNLTDADLTALLANLPADGDTMVAWEGYCRDLFDLMIAANLWHPASDGTDPLHVALHNQHRAEHVGELRKAQLVTFTKRAHDAATKKLEG